MTAIMKVIGLITITIRAIAEGIGDARNKQTKLLSNYILQKIKGEVTVVVVHET